MPPWLENIYLSDAKFVRCRAGTSSECACPTTDLTNWIKRNNIFSISGGHFLPIWRKIKGYTLTKIPKFEDFSMFGKSVWWIFFHFFNFGWPFGGMAIVFFWFGFWKKCFFPNGSIPKVIHLMRKSCSNYRMLWKERNLLKFWKSFVRIWERTWTLELVTICIVNRTMYCRARNNPFETKPKKQDTNQSFCTECWWLSAFFDSE